MLALLALDAGALMTSPFLAFTGAAFSTGLAAFGRTMLSMRAQRVVRALGSGAAVRDTSMVGRASIMALYATSAVISSRVSSKLCSFADIEILCTTITFLEDRTFIFNDTEIH